ncbi:hypothetical protein D9M69_377980 [compost metagenome]
MRRGGLSHGGDGVAVVRLVSALDLDPDELLLELEVLPLYEEFAERFDEALHLLTEGRSLWRPHGDQPWAIEAVAEVRRKLSNIEQYAERNPSSGLAWAVRSAAVWDARATDSQLVAAFVMARSCQAIEVLWDWMDGLESPWQGDTPGSFAALATDDPEGHALLIDEERRADPAGEIEACERAAELLGRARLALMLANLHQHPEIPGEVIARISQEAVSQFRQVVARKGGRESGKARQGDVVGRNAAIHARGQALLNAGRSPRDIAGMIAKDDAVGAGLTAKSIRKILRAGGVLPPTTAAD